jgi:protease-4
MYDLFLDRVAEGRGLERSKIEPAAEGRIMGGADGKEEHLVDEIGGLDRAIAIALELAELDPKTPVQVMRAPSGLLSLLGLDSPEARIATGVALEREAARRLAEAILPMSRELRGFTGSIMPLTQGEHVLAALPFALAVR